MAFLDRLAGSASINAPIQNKPQNQNFGASFEGSETGINKNVNQFVKRVERPGENNINIGKNPYHSSTNPIKNSEKANPLEGFDSSVLAKYDGRDRSPNSADSLHGSNLYELA